MTVSSCCASLERLVVSTYCALLARPFLGVLWVSPDTGFAAALKVLFHRAFLCRLAPTNSMSGGQGRRYLHDVFFRIEAKKKAGALRTGLQAQQTDLAVAVHAERHRRTTRLMRTHIRRRI